MHPRRRTVSALLFAALFLLGRAAPTDAQKQPGPLQPNPKAPVVKAFVPLAAHPGQTFDLTLTGANLNEPIGLHTSLPMRATFPVKETPGVVRLEVPKETPLGIYPIRLATVNGLSNVRLLCVDDLPQVMEDPANKNRSVQTAQPVTPPCVVVGRADAEVADFFKVTVQAGQRLSFEVLGRRLGSAFDPQIRLYDVKTGREVPAAYSQDAPGLQTDPRLTWTFKEAGDYAVEVRDVKLRGGEDFYYRLRIGDFPCAVTPLPLAIQRGTKATIRFAGPQVEGVVPVEVTAPADPLADAIQVTPRGANGLAGWPVSLAVSDLTELVETEPNNEPAKANRLTIPGAISGVVQTKGDVDYFVFTVKKGQRYLIEAQTAELGSPADVFLTVRDAKGTALKSSDPMAFIARLDFTAADDGDSTLSVEHLHGWGGPDQSYRVTVLPYEPGFDLSIGLDRFDLAPGGTLALPIQATRRDYAGPIEVSVVGPKGLTGTVTIPMGQPQQPNQPGATLTVTAAADLPPGPTSFKIVGKAMVGSQMVSSFVSVRGVVSAALGGLPLPPRESFTSIGLTVKEAPPFTLAAKLAAPDTMVGKPIELTVTVTRAAGFAGEVILSAANLPANVTADFKPIPAGMNEIKVMIAPAATAAPGNFPIVVTGKAKHREKEYVINAAPFALILKK